MKKWLIAGVAAAVCAAILLAIGVGRQISMLRRIESLTIMVENLRETVGDMDRELSSVRWKLDEICEDADSLLTLEDVTTGDFHPETGTVDVHLKLVPKILTEDMELSVTMKDQTLVLTRYDTIFTGVLKVGLFDNESEPVLTITTAAGTQTQTLETVCYDIFYQNYLPQVSKNMFGVSDGTDGKTTLDVGFCFDRSMLLPEMAADFESVTLVRQRDGQQEQRQDITGMLQDAGEDRISEYTTSFQIGQDEEMLVQVTAVDTYGYVHQMSVRCYAEENSEGTVWHQDETHQICDPSGNVVYSEKYQDYL